MKRKKHHAQQSTYTIQRDKLMDRDERRQILKTCRTRAEADLHKGRTTWPIRYMLVHLALYSGLRVSEISALKVDDLVLQANDPYLMVWRGKGNKKRQVYLTEHLAQHLREYLAYRKKVLRQVVDETSPVFPSPQGEHVPSITLMKSFKRAVGEAGLRRDLSIHCARHTYATYLLHDTGNLRYVKNQLGHTNIAMTALYADILPEENGRLANMIKYDEDEPETKSKTNKPRKP